MGRFPPTAPPSPFSRFYKLHERKCEPIVMTVPRKVRPPHSPVHPLPPLAGRPLRGDQSEACDWNVAECGYSQWAGQTPACWAVLCRGQLG